jgi:hypothetical protein
MSTFATSFRDEVCRLARKEAKAAVAPIRKPAGATRSAFSPSRPSRLRGRISPTTRVGTALQSLTFGDRRNHEETNELLDLPLQPGQVPD